MGDEDAVAKKLSFMDAGVGVSMQDGALLKWRQQSSDTANGPHAANLRAVTDLRKVLHELSDEAQQRQTIILKTAHSAAVGGGENDLKRLRRQFQAQKATYINFDVKERFMQGLQGFSVGAHPNERANSASERQLESTADALRAIKVQNSQARERIAAAVQGLVDCYSRVGVMTQATRKQLDTLQQELERHEASRPPPASPMEPGPSLVHCKEKLQEEMACAKALEASAAAAEAENADMRARLLAGEQELAAVRAEVGELEAVREARTKAVTADQRLQHTLQWCSTLYEATTALTGVSVLSATQAAVHLQLRFSVPLSKGATPPAAMHAATTCTPASAEGGAAGKPFEAAAHAAYAEVEAELSMQLGADGALRDAALSPGVVDVEDLLQAAREQPEPMRFLVREAAARLTAYWWYQVQLEAAAERYSVVRLGAGTGGGSLVKATVPLAPPASELGAGQKELKQERALIVEVAVPAGWPEAGALRLLRAAAPGAGTPEAARRACEELVASINVDAALCSCGLREFLEGVSQRAAAGTDELFG